MRSLTESADFDLGRLREKRRKYLPLRKFQLAVIRTITAMSHRQLITDAC
jgi:hypothetical protein